jgi:hypothetical protein
METTLHLYKHRKINLKEAISPANKKHKDFTIKNLYQQPSNIMKTVHLKYEYNTQHYNISQKDYRLSQLALL